MLRVRYFAIAKERTGVAEESLDFTGDVRGLVAKLVEAHPSLEDVVPACRVAVNHAFAQPDDAVPDGAEVALIPPVAGG